MNRACKQTAISPESHASEATSAKGWTKTRICIECGRLAAKAFRAKNIEIIREADRERNALWRKTNPARAIEAQRNWRARNLDKRAAGEHRRRARKAGSGGSYTSEDLREIFKMQRGKCALCSCKVTPRSWHVDHIQPLSRGGSNDRRNIQILCRPCNLSKGSHDPIEFARSRGGLL